MAYLDHNTRYSVSASGLPTLRAAGNKKATALLRPSCSTVTRLLSAQSAKPIALDSGTESTSP